jgi:hypothetical protein
MLALSSTTSMSPLPSVSISSKAASRSTCRQNGGERGLLCCRTGGGGSA